ncbi:hypothetical protein [Thermomonospora curvata]|uniref:Uncharacterized protein n=1 Tax=Thermomonospora curvata (strain ATCC 19995 / DSM 43183 / JCM 3096 / KCTC 9072 / NBRC 15933 / NCIMB 10081 / Henssen B9) TaxID=471852 RepID=D1A3N0_THECD|nr:hypothetical protein [Thermomonospora curvata]ACY96155.1 hypothetical protein Tcur_0558 [Thermomonospora curvata DSM 43183]
MTASLDGLELFPWEVRGEDGEIHESGVSGDWAAASRAAIRALETRPAGWTACVWSARLNPLEYDYRKVIGRGSGKQARPGSSGGPAGAAARFPTRRAAAPQRRGIRRG